MSSWSSIWKILNEISLILVEFKWKYLYNALWVKIWAPVSGSQHILKSSLWWIADLNMKGKTIQILEEDIRKCLYDLGLGKDFLNRILKLQITEENNDKLDHIKIRNFLFSEDVINKVKRQTTKCGKTCISNKGCISRYMKNS